MTKSYWLIPLLNHLSFRRTIPSTCSNWRNRRFHEKEDWSRENFCIRCSCIEGICGSFSSDYTFNLFKLAKSAISRKRRLISWKLLYQALLQRGNLWLLCNEHRWANFNADMDGCIKWHCHTRGYIDFQAIARGCIDFQATARGYFQATARGCIDFQATARGCIGFQATARGVYRLPGDCQGVV
jgi:hypothetical protein